MASMYPEQLPKELSSAAERLLFQQLKENLPDDYTVIWHAHIMINLLGHCNSKEQVTIDFLLVHPHYGMLVLAVQGGAVEYDEQSHEWYTIDRSQQRRKLSKSPLAQAMNYMYLLCAQLDRQGLRYNGTVGYAAVLPDVDMLHATRIAHNAHIAPNLLLNDKKIQSAMIQQSIECIHQYYNQTRDSSVPGKEGARRIINAYKRSWFLAVPHLNATNDREQQQVKLTEQQFVQLEKLGAHSRAAIYGCSGTGKTLLAIEKARQLARNGLRVLFICYSTKLATNLATQLDGEKLADSLLHNIHIYNFHTFCKVHLEARLRFSIYDDPYMLYLLKRIRNADVRYDAIVVDEGQDFRASWWIGLQALLRTKESVLYAFYDNNQNVYKRPLCDQYIPLEQHYPLSWNCRSTQKIHQKMLNYYDAMPGTLMDGGPLCSGPRGREIEYITTHKQSRDLHISEQDALANLLDFLIYDQKRYITSIILLTPLEQNKSRFQAEIVVGERYYLSWTKKRNTIMHGCYILTCSSIHDFRGQERDIVILVELDTLSHAREAEIMLYMAISRARQHFVVLGPGNSAAEKLFRRKARQSE